MLNGKHRIMVVGLGNRAVTPDALGPYVVDNLYITRHLINEGIYDSSMEISALCPGVMAQTGMETLDILRAVVKEIKPELVIAVDALAARNASRLNSTIQIADTGISPGSGVGNNRKALNEKELGCKVIAIGVPTVISVPAIVNDSMETMLAALGQGEAKKAVEQFTEEERYQLASAMVEPDLASMFVTPKNIDEAVKRVSYTISEAINRLLDVY
jgi:spore protease